MAARRKAGAGKVIVLGIPEIDRRLKLLRPALEKRIVTRSIRAALGPVRDAVKEAAPVASGATRKAVKIRAPKANRGRVGAEVRIGKGDYQGDQFYAAFVEFGTAKMEGRHFMERALEEAGDGARQDAQRLILAEAEAAVAELRGQ